MKRVITTALTFLAMSVPAMAADMRARVAPRAPAAYLEPVSVYNWTGLYVGGHVGFGFGDNDNNFGLAGVSSNDGNGFLAGAQIGYDWQVSPNWVLGLEGQLSWVDFNRSWAGPGFAVSQSNDWLGSVTGRVGYTWGAGLLYVKGGVAFADNEYNLVVAGVPAAFATNNNSRTGWTLGAGLEYMFAPAWSAKLEYQYFNFGNTTLAGPAPFAPGVSVDDNIHTVKLGVNYRFNWSGPVAARY